MDVTLTVPDFNGAFDYVLAHRMEELMAIAFSDQTEEERTEATVALFLEALQQDGETTQLSGPLHLTKVDGSWKIEQDESFDALFSNLFSAPDVVELPYPKPSPTKQNKMPDGVHREAGRPYSISFQFRGARVGPSWPCACLLHMLLYYPQL